VAAAGLASLVGSLAFFVISGGEDPSLGAEATVRSLDSMVDTSKKVKSLDMSAYDKVVQTASKPPAVAPVADNDKSFLVSGRRVFCKLCREPIPAGVKICPACNQAQPEPEKVAVDSDGDGLLDDWETKYGLDPKNPADADADKDGDGFSNFEEYAAKTDPTDKSSHPDYLDGVALRLPLKETVLPFYLRSYLKTPNGVRLEFFDEKKRNDYGTLGKRYSVLVGADVGDTGFVAKDFKQQSRKVKIAGGGGAEKSVDVSFATLERKSDKKKVVLVVAAGKKVQLPPVDVQATLAYERDGRIFDVVAGSEFQLNLGKYKVLDVKSENKTAKVTLVDTISGKKRTLEALEQ
jgi:hypothetical protein